MPEGSDSLQPRAPKYPTGNTEELLESDLVTPQTRQAIEERLHAKLASPRFFDAAQFRTLRAVCERLIPQPDRAEPIDLAAAVDDRLARNAGKGWRYASMPSDREAYPIGIRGIDECARSLFNSDFALLSGDRQDEVIRRVQHGTAVGTAWNAIPSSIFFEELLAELAESYYSHPLAQEEIGYVGFADVRAWNEMGLDRLEPHEPRPLQ